VFKRLEATVGMSREVTQPRVSPGLSHRLHVRTVKVSVSRGSHKVNVFRASVVQTTKWPYCPTAAKLTTPNVSPAAKLGAPPANA
jgi:hypothetical protein